MAPPTTRLHTALANGATTEYQYFQNNWLDSVAYPNQTSAAYTYDKAGRVDTIFNTKLSDNSVISSFDYDYDDNGNRIEQIEIQNGFAASQQQTTTYGYDLLDRMETVAILDADSGDLEETTYTFYPSYDRKTEEVSLTQNGTPTTLKNRTYAYDETNWLTTISEDSSGNQIIYSYDNNGNTLSKVDNIKVPAETLTFTYNSRDQLVQTQRGPPAALVSLGRYDYNYAGMRIRHLDSERGDVEYIYDGQSVLEEVQNGSNSLLAHYRYADRLLSLATPSDTQFYHFATLGTTANLSDGNGDIQVSYRTDAYGEITHQEGNSVNRQVFTGQEHDEQTGLIYFGARFYDPDVGRFINQDSYLGEPGTPPSLHRYLYAYGNPTVYIDPDGHAVGTVTGSVAGFFWGFGQMAGSMINDTINGEIKGTGDYLSTWGQNIVGGAELGASFDVALFSAGAAIPASGALGGAGFNALTFGGQGDSLKEFGKGQLEGAAYGAVGGVVFSKAAPLLGKAGEWAASKSQAVKNTLYKAGDMVRSANTKLVNSQVANDLGILADKVQIGVSATKEKLSGLLSPSTSNASKNSATNSQIRSAADKMADESSAIRPNKARPNVAGAMEKDGIIDTRYSMRRNQEPELHQMVDDWMENYTGRKGAGHGKCFEPQCVSDKLFRNENPIGAKSDARIIKSSPEKPGHSTKIPACPTCDSMLKDFGIFDLNNIIYNSRSGASGAFSEMLLNSDEGQGSDN